jgi:hypothetical protein
MVDNVVTQQDRIQILTEPRLPLDLPINVVLGRPKKRIERCKRLSVACERPPTVLVVAASPTSRPVLPHPETLRTGGDNRNPLNTTRTLSINRNTRQPL